MAKYNFQISYAPSRPRSSRRTATAASVTSVAAAPAVDISGKLDKAEFYRYFEEVNIGTAEAPVYATRSKRGLFSDSFVSALGLNPNTGGGGGGGATALSELSDVQLSGLLTGDVLIYDGAHWVNRPQSSIVPDLSEYATRTWVQQQGYATSAALAAHAGDTAIHISSAERTLWNKTAADFAAIVGEDSDQIINKWEEVVAFLDTYTEADTLANLLSNKVDKTTRVVAGTGLSGGGALTGDVALSLASRTLWGQTYDGSKNVSGDMMDVGSISASGEIVTTSSSAFRMINGSYGAFFLQDGSSLYLMLTNANDQYGSFNNLRPLQVTLGTGDVSLCSTIYVKHSEGNVGIGTSIPSYKLDVAGEARLQNRLYFGDSAHYIELDENGDFHFSHGVYSDSFLSALGLNPNTGGGGGGGSYDRLDAWDEYTSERAGWVLSAALGYDLHSRVSSLEGDSALSFTPEGSGNVVTAVKKSGTSVTVTKGLTALTAHQPIYSLAFQAGAFEAKKYTPNTGVQTVNVPTKVSHLSNDSGFITSAALAGYATQSWVQGLGYITATTAEATFATKLGVSGNQIGTYVSGKLGNLITVPYATNAASLAAARTIWGQKFDGTAPVSGNMTGVGSISASGEIVTTSSSAFRMVYGSYGTFFLQDGSSLYLMQTNANDQYGSFNNLRPLQVTLGTGDVSLCSTIYVKHSEGNVGIGTSIPSYKLDVAGDIHSSEYIRADKAVLAPFLRGNTSNGAFVGDAVEGLGEGFTGLLLYSYGYTPIHMATSGYVRAIITAGGYFGIGTSSPAYKLDVAGEARLQNRLYFGDSAHYIELDENGYFHFSHGVYTDGFLSALGLNSSGSTISLWGNTYDGKNSIDGVIRSIYAADPTEGTIIGKFLAKKSDPLGLILRTYTNGAVSLQSQRENDNLKRFVLALNPLGGNVAINQTSASYTLDVAGTIKASVDIIATGTVTAKDFIKPSDARLKTYMEDIELTVSDIANAPAWRYKWKSDGSIDVGSTTQYWAARVPELTHLLADGIHLGLDYGKAALLSVVAVARSTADHERRIADIERQLQNRTI